MKKLIERRTNDWNYLKNLFFLPRKEGKEKK